MVVVKKEKKGFVLGFIDFHYDENRRRHSHLCAVDMAATLRHGDDIIATASAIFGKANKRISHIYTEGGSNSARTMSPPLSDSLSYSDFQPSFLEGLGSNP